MTCALLIISAMYPSFGALATALAAVTPPAPTRFSTTTGCPRISDNGSATIRAAMSVPPPAPKPTRMRMVRVGHSCALACNMPTSIAARITTPVTSARTLHGIEFLPTRRRFSYSLNREGKCRQCLLRALSNRLIIFADVLVRAQHGVDRLEHLAHARFRHRAFHHHDKLRFVR